jgi:hypothetical protein
MNLGSYPITRSLDDQGNRIWIVNGERYYSLREAEERQSELAGDTDRPDIAAAEQPNG